MDTIHNPIQEYADRNEAIIYLAERLNKGQLALFLGAGVSKFLGFPIWLELVNKGLEKVGAPERVSKSDTNEILRSKAEKIEKIAGDRFNELMSECLYEGIDKNDIDTKTSIIFNNLLVAISALLMGSKRGCIDTVLTLNYDDVLEKYLNLHGIKTEVIYKLPRLIGNGDVKVYHPHGFLPFFTEYRSNEKIIFSKYSYSAFQAGKDIPWKNLTGELLLSKIFIFIGLSGDDPNLEHLTVGTKEAVKDSRFVGFWIFIGDISQEKKEEFYRRNIVPVCLPKDSDVPYFLFSICQKAAMNIF